MSPQLSFDRASEVHRLQIVLQLDELRGRTLVQLTAYNREGVQLASGGASAVGLVETELVPELVAKAATGWLYKGQEECIKRPLAAFRAARAALDRYSS